VSIPSGRLSARSAVVAPAATSVISLS
jgi:hypothetical protein